MHPGWIAHAASHCKGLQEAVCGSTAACRWMAAREPAFGVSPRKAHCRLDMKAAASLAAKIAADQKPAEQPK
jgi:hypothetical protein